MTDQWHIVILLSCTISFILTIWFKTDAFVEYFRFLPIVKRYQKYKLETGLHFTDFITFYENSFLRRLIGCPHCISFWLVLLCLCVLPYQYLPAVYIISQILYKQV